MKIAIAFRPPLRRWQCRLADALRTAGHEVILAAGLRRRPLSIADVALAFQQGLFGPRPSLFDRAPPNDVSRSLRWIDIDRLVDVSADLLLALDGVKSDVTPVLTPLFDGVAGDAALLSMIAKVEPNVQLLLKEGERTLIISHAILAIEDRDTLCRALDQVLARIVTLILQGVRRLEAAVVPADTQVTTHATEGAPLRHIAMGLVRKIVARLAGRARGPDHWRTKYRLSEATSGGAIDPSWLAAAFATVSDDGARFYADPMPFSHAGRDYIFVEEYPYATRKGVITVIEIVEGVASTPRIVLERPYHVSYPFLLRRGDDVYLLPEMSEAGCVQLFRAASFPDRWVEDHVLIDGIKAADATPVFHAGRWWMFAALSEDGGSSWDQLAIFHAPDLFGPWVAHAGNPVLVDAGAARPAGAMWFEDGALMRVAQDCRQGYGTGLTICRVDQLDEDGYRQTVVSRLTPPDGCGAAGIHTLGRNGHLEVIDLRFSSVDR